MDPTFLYAVSETDAQKMVLAYLDGLNQDVTNAIERHKEELKYCEQELQKAQQELPQKLSERDQVQADLKHVRDIRHKAEENADDKANQTIAEMRDTLDKLEIEFKGLDAKLKVIEEYRNQNSGKTLSPQVQLRLDEMHMELVIDMSGLEARKVTAKRILAQETEFLDLRKRLARLQGTVVHLRRRITDHQQRIATATAAIENPGPAMLPPKAYKNRVQIYRVKGSTTPQDVENFLQGIEGSLASTLPKTRITDLWIRRVDEFLKMVDEGYLHMEPDVVAQLQGTESRLHVGRVKEFMRLVDSTKMKLTGAVNIRDIHVAKLLNDFLRHEAPVADQYLAQAEEGTLALDTVTISRLQGVREELVSEVTEAFLEKGETLLAELKTRRAAGVFLTQTTEGLLDIIRRHEIETSQEWLADLTQRLEDFRKKYDK